MQKRKVEIELLRLLKNKNGDDLIYSVLNMVNGTYEYENEYLNSIPYNVMMVYLEKVIVLGGHFDRKIKNIQDAFDALLIFVNRIDKIRYRDVLGNTLQSLSYNIKIHKERVKKNTPYIKRITCLVLAGALFFTYVGRQQAKENDVIIVDKPAIEEQVEISMLEQKQMDDQITKKVVEEVQAKKVEEPVNTETPLQILMESYNLNENEFAVLCAIVLSEAKDDSYEDAYAVINTIYNRTQSQQWIQYVDGICGEGTGKNLYYQATLPGQFVVYEKVIYLSKMNNKRSSGYQAIIDFLASKNIKHDYLSFRSNDSIVANSVQFVNGGNRYFDLLLNEDRVIENAEKSL